MTCGELLAIVFTLGWVPLWIFRAETVTDALPFYDRNERFWVYAIVGFLSAHITAACLTLTLRPPPPAGRCALAAVVFASGVSFWLWGRALIGPLGEPRLPEEPPLMLRRDGAFGVVRHPLYFGVLVAASAPVIATARIEIAATFVLAAAAVVARALQEEQRLRAQLGEQYDAYCREVKRLIPFVW